MHSFVLPTELVADVLEHLLLDQLWTAARVSRLFYASAWRAGLVIHRTLYLDASGSYASEFDVLRDILAHWHAGRNRIRLSVEVASFIPGHDHPNLHPTPSAYNLCGAPEILTIIAAALPLLVDLSIELPDCFRHQLDEALSTSAAPLLRKLNLHGLLSDGPRVIPLPSTIFAGSAPQLQNVSLTNMALPDQPVAAFRTVSRAQIIYERVFPHLAFSSHFPQLATLRMDYRASDEDAPTPDSFELSGLCLRKLIVDDSYFTNLLQSVERSVDLFTIPHVLTVGDSVRWNDKVWTEDSAPLSVRVSSCFSECAEVAIIVTPAHRRWQRLLRERELGHDEPLPIGGMPNIGARMTYLRIDSDFVRGFLHLELTLPALRRIHIDIESRHSDFWALSPPECPSNIDLPSFYAVSCAPEDAPRVWTPCAALRKITLFALHEPVSDVGSRYVAFLARALGQLERAAADRTTLELVGVEFKQPVEHGLLGEVVSGVHTRAFCGHDSLEDYDDGLWEHEFSMADRV